MGVMKLARFSLIFVLAFPGIYFSYKVKLFSSFSCIS